jgi:uncharacterized membrane protein
MTTVFATPSDERRHRTLLLISLALNLFFIGVTAAFVVRTYWPQPATPSFEPSRNAAAHIDRLAGTLPAEDAARLRAVFHGREQTVEAAHSGYRAAQDAVRGALRTEPFNLAHLKAAMANTRVARQRLDEVLQDVIATATVEMTPAGRDKLAEWPPQRR